MSKEFIVSAGARVYCTNIDDQRSGQIGIICDEPPKYGDVTVEWPDKTQGKTSRNHLMPAELLISMAQKLTELDNKFSDPSDILDDLSVTNLLALILARAQTLEHRLDEDPDAKAFLLRRRLCDALNRMSLAIKCGSEAPDVAEAVAEWEETFVTSDEDEIEDEETE